MKDRLSKPKNGCADNFNCLSTLFSWFSTVLGERFRRLVIWRSDVPSLRLKLKLNGIFWAFSTSAFIVSKMRFVMNGIFSRRFSSV